MEGLKYVVAATVVFSQMASLCYAAPGPFVAKMPAQCANTTFCFDKHEDYPTKLIDNLLNDTGLVDRTETIGDRLSPEIAPNECNAERRTDQIYEIVDKQGIARYVIQSDKRFRQAVTTEKCTNPGRIVGQTRNLSFDMLSMTSFTCEQTTLDFKFVVLSLDGKSMEAVGVQGGLPVCCACVRNE